MNTERNPSGPYPQVFYRVNKGDIFRPTNTSAPLGTAIADALSLMAVTAVVTFALIMSVVLGGCAEPLACDGPLDKATTYGLSCEAADCVRADCDDVTSYTCVLDCAQLVLDEHCTTSSESNRDHIAAETMAALTGHRDCGTTEVPDGSVQ